VAIDVEEFDCDRIIYDHGGLVIRAFEVDHGDVIKPAYGYRIEYARRIVVISGDTRPSSNVIRHAKGSDVLVHEVAIVRPELAAEPFIQRIMAHHTTAREAGSIFSETLPRLAVFTHLVFLSSTSIPPATIDDLIADTRQTYAGPLEIGADLMSIEIAETIRVTRRNLNSP
jgi:ribonuclease Z